MLEKQKKCKKWLPVGGELQEILRNRICFTCPLTCRRITSQDERAHAAYAKQLKVAAWSRSPAVLECRKRATQLRIWPCVSTSVTVLRLGARQFWLCQQLPLLERSADSTSVADWVPGSCQH